jgi:phage terminase small subunit
MLEGLPMTAKQKRFCNEYLIDCNATQAAIRAGYSAKTAYSVGQRMLKNVEVKKYIDEQFEKLKNDNIADTQEIMEYLTSVMRGEQKEQVPLMYYDKQILEEKSASIKERLKAAELLGKRYGLFTS